jgi:hypothetical protein
MDNKPEEEMYGPAAHEQGIRCDNQREEKNSEKHRPCNEAVLVVVALLEAALPGEHLVRRRRRHCWTFANKAGHVRTSTKKQQRGDGKKKRFGIICMQRNQYPPYKQQVIENKGDTREITRWRKRLLLCPRREDGSDAAILSPPTIEEKNQEFGGDERKGRKERGTEGKKTGAILALAGEHG